MCGRILFSKAFERGGTTTLVPGMWRRIAP